MPLRFDEKRATQALSLLLKLSGKPVTLHKLLHLCYLADRKNTIERGMPFIGTSFIRVPTGPTSVEIYQAIYGIKYFSKYLKVKEYDLKIIKDPGDGALTDHQAEILENLYDKYKDTSNYDIRVYIMSLPEVRKAKLYQIISLEDIWKAESISDSEIERFKSLIEQW